MTDVNVVSPMNMGERLDWDAKGKKYNVNVEDLLEEIGQLKQEIQQLKDNETIGVTPSIDDPEEYFNLDSDLTGLGMKVFYGNIMVMNDPDTATDTFKLYVQRGYIVQQGSGKKIKVPAFIKGFPPKEVRSYSAGETTQSAYQIEDFQGNQDYDFTGYQFATPVEIVQVIYLQSQMMIRTNDAGMRNDGALVNTNGWGVWRKI